MEIDKKKDANKHTETYRVRKREIATRERERERSSFYLVFLLKNPKLIYKELIIYRHIFDTLTH